ncbi:hypothetical protein SAMN05428642_105125 [Flaviramulus basaltis]|uniref:DUF3872 domain-containing protein n=1 Tax=Flaviramulus basaltis TaxID=369401 RepID=A0A1K2ISZ1_9FLAO|nr:hypothetical protein [Flaviramulus basaltis]SFZ94835.1 hypothetical protein SAMN05428642_105125 [Flaviramulus basaltis]
MKKHANIIKALFGLFTFLILLFFGCSKDFDPIILDNFDFNFTEEHDEDGFVFTPTKTSFSLIPEKEITTVSYHMKYNISDAEGYFLTIEGDTIKANDTLNVSKLNFAYNYMPLNTGIHKVKVIAWDSNSNKKELELLYDTKFSDFSFLLNKGSNKFIINSKTPINVTLIRNIVTDEENEFVMTYQVENGTGKLYYEDEEYGEGKEFLLPKGQSELSYLPETLGEHKLIVTAKAPDGATKTEELILMVLNKDYLFTANALDTDEFTGNPVAVNFNISELDVGGETYTMFYTSGDSNGSLEYDGQTYAPGEIFSVPVGSFTGTYTGISEGNHVIIFNVRSSSDVPKTATVNIQYIKYEEFFDLTVSQSSQDKYENQPFLLTAVTSATSEHDLKVTYNMTFNFTGATAGFITYKGRSYREGESIPLDYGSTPLQFYPQTDENFTINFRVENSTGIAQTVSEPITMFKKPMVKVKGEKHNISCGGWNGCDYTVRIHTCWDVSCSEAFNGASLQRVEVRIWNRKSGKWDTFLFSYNDARGTGVNRYFTLETMGKENDLKYLDQRYEVRIQDSNGQWSETERGSIIRV